MAAGSNGSPRVAGEPLIAVQRTGMARHGGEELQTAKFHVHVERRELMPNQGGVDGRVHSSNAFVKGDHTGPA